MGHVKNYPPYLDYPKPHKPIANADRTCEMTEHRWIPVTERLPERQNEYLVLWRAKGFRAAGLFYAILEFEPGEESWVDDLPQAAAVGGFEVEYWMPLPGLPEEEETEADG